MAFDMLQLRKTLLIAAFALLVPVVARAEGQIESRLLRPGHSAVADFDGDNIIDIVSSIRTAHTEQGYTYSVELNFTKNPTPHLFTVYSNEPTGLNIQAIDIDGDHDLDLVITGHLLHYLIGIWTNDGTGRFTRNDPGDDGRSIFQATVSLSSSSPSGTPISDVEARRPLIVLNDARGDWIAFPSLPATCIPDFAGVAQIAIESARFRSPPPRLS
jgi:hypothetical protein